MAIWPFNRKRQDQALPEEVQDYYDSSRKQRTGMAWLLALGTLVVTVLLAVLLFFGGRWVYQQFAGDDEPAQETTQTESPEQDATDQAATPSGNNQQGASNQQGSSSTNTATPSPATPAPTPNTGSTGSEIPATGPGPGGLQ